MKKLCFLLALLFVFCLCGCESNLDTDDRDEDDDDEVVVTLTAEEALEEALQALTGGESSGYAVILGADGYPSVPQNTGIAQLLSSYVTFDIEDFSSKKDTATASIEISAPDAPQLLKQAVAQLETVDADSLSAQLQPLLEQGPPMIDYVVEVQLVQVDKTWCVVPSFELSNALTGGLTQAYMDAQQNLLSQLLEGGEAA